MNIWKTYKETSLVIKMSVGFFFGPCYRRHLPRTSLYSQPLGRYFYPPTQFDCNTRNFSDGCAGNWQNECQANG